MKKAISYSIAFVTLALIILVLVVIYSPPVPEKIVLSEPSISPDVGTPAFCRQYQF